MYTVRSGKDFSQEDLDYLIHSFTNKESISREDFAVTLYKGLIQKSQEAFEDAFDLFHPSGTGTMTQAELQSALQKTVVCTFF